MFALPQEAGIIESLRPAFTQPTFDRFVTLLIGAIVTMGGRRFGKYCWNISWLPHDGAKSAKVEDAWRETAVQM